MRINQNNFADSINTAEDLLIYSEDTGSELCMEILNNTAHKLFEFSTNSGGVIKIEDLPNLSTNNNSVPVITTGNIQNIADCFP
ncbi:hypothetical protein Pan153_05960 [Gimesia panareensis]|uniref:Uncharacterized protein n=2 Tax=Gimesia panareensis TaxID=2527978 RepID=A0A518FHZ9_9PLAN|nr:hypothetical protein Pan153_05960 [Gimesia panareensis]